MNDFIKGDAAYALIDGRIVECTIMVTAEKDGRAETHEAYLYQGKYYTGKWQFYDEEYITKIEPIVNMTSASC